MAKHRVGRELGQKGRVGAGRFGAAISRTRARRAAGAAGRHALSSLIRSGDVIVSHPLFELSECPVQPRRDRGGRDPEQACRLLARESSTTRSATTSRSPAVRARSPSSSSGEKPSPNACSSASRGAPALGALLATLAPRVGAEPIERRRACDGEQPRTMCSAARIEPLPAAERRLERLARQVLGERPVLRQVQEVAVDVVEQLFGDRRERRRGQSVRRGASSVTACMPVLRRRRPLVTAIRRLRTGAPTGRAALSARRVQLDARRGRPCSPSPRRASPRARRLAPRSSRSVLPRARAPRAPSAPHGVAALGPAATPPPAAAAGQLRASLTREIRPAALVRAQ